MMATPSEQDFIGAVKHKTIPNTKITVPDIKNADAIFGTDLGAIQGKIVWKTPGHVMTNCVMVPNDILPHHKIATLGAGMMFVNEIPFFITISRNIKFFTGEQLRDQKEGTMIKALIKVCQLCKGRGFEVRTCLMDNQFECPRDEFRLQKPSVKLNICGPGEHVPDIERGIRTIKERTRSVATTLPFAKLPRSLLIHIVFFVMMWLNFLPPAHGTSNTLSPQAIVRGISADAKIHCKVPFLSLIHI